MPQLSLPHLARLLASHRIDWRRRWPPPGPLQHPFPFLGQLALWAIVSLMGLVLEGQAAPLDQSWSSQVRPPGPLGTDGPAGAAGAGTKVSKVNRFSVTETLEFGINLKAVNQVVYVTGTIDADQDVRMRDLALAMVRRGRLPSLVVFLSNDGGHLGAAIRLGRLIRELGAQTAVLGTCASACIYAYAGGVRRASTPDSHFGLHLARRAQGPGGNATEDEQVAVQRFEFLDEMGIDPALVTWETELALDQVRWLTPEETQAMGLTNQVLATEEIPLPPR